MILRPIPITKEMKDYGKVEKLAKGAFPQKECLAPSTLIEMAKSDDFDFFALYDEETFVGFIAIRTYKEMTYLLFLAIAPTLRFQGYGKRAVETPRSLYPDTQQVVDMEMPDKNAENAKQHVRRRGFYLQNGYKPTGHYLAYRKVNFEILCMANYFNFNLSREMMSHLSVPDFNPECFETGI